MSTFAHPRPRALISSTLTSATAHATPAPEHGSDQLALFCGQQFAVAEQGMSEALGQHHRGGDERAPHRRRDQPRPFRTAGKRANR